MYKPHFQCFVRSFEPFIWQKGDKLYNFVRELSIKLETIFLITLEILHIHGHSEETSMVWGIAMWTQEYFGKLSLITEW